jgi:hypothetical protein
MSSSVENSHSYRQYVPQQQPQLPPVIVRKRMGEGMGFLLALLIVAVIGFAVAAITPDRHCDDSGAMCRPQP